MLTISEAYKKIIASNIRPKSEPTITVTGKDENGNSVSLEWNADQIQNLTFKRGIDPIGRELPYMELTWTEIYTGNLNPENYPEKYNNIVKYMAVDLTIKQDLAFNNTWKTIFEGGFTWKSLLETFGTWKNVKKQVSQEVLTMPRMFLASKPVIQGKTITWTARDLLYFLESNQSKGFESEIPYRNALRWFLLDERANVRNSVELLEAVQDTQSQLLESDTQLLNKNVVADGNTKSVLLGLANIKNYYWNFSGNTAKLQSLGDLAEKLSWLPVDTIYDFTSNVIFDYPTLTANPTMSAYSFKQYVCELDEENTYTMSPYETITFKDATFYHYAFKGLGKATGTTAVEGITRSTYAEESTLDIIPANLNGIEFYVQNSSRGEVFTEDNSCNPYNNNDTEIQNRISYINTYFLSGGYSGGVVSLPNFALEPNDFVSVETNLFSGEDRLTKDAVVLGIDLEYNGAWKQKTKLHII